MRAKGKRNMAFEARRAELLSRLKARLSQRGAMRPTLRELALAAGCSISTLKHYFGRRDDIVLAVFAQSNAQAGPHLTRVAEPLPEFAASIRVAVEEAWTVLADLGASRTLAMGLIEGLGEARLGAGYLQRMFDPYLIALSERLQAHMQRGEMRPVDPRIAALSLASPLLLAALHQAELHGDALWRLDAAALVDQVSDSFVRAHAAEGQHGMAAAPAPAVPTRPVTVAIPPDRAEPALADLPEPG